MKFYKRSLAIFAMVLLSSNGFAHNCKLSKLRKDLVFLGFTRGEAVLLVGSLEAFLLNLDFSKLRLKNNPLEGTPDQLRIDLLNLGYSENRVNSIVSSVNLIRSLSEELKVAPTDPKCLGMK